MSSRRRRRLFERRLTRAGGRVPISTWSVIIIALVALAVVLARIFK